MTLTKKEKAAVRKAIQMVHDREVSFSCDGLWAASGYSFPLVRKYGKFFGKHYGQSWWTFDRDDTRARDRVVNERLTALSLFLASGGDL